MIKEVLWEMDSSSKEEVRYSEKINLGRIALRLAVGKIMILRFEPSIE